MLVDAVLLGRHLLNNLEALLTGFFRTHMKSHSVNNLLRAEAVQVGGRVVYNILYQPISDVLPLPSLALVSTWSWSLPLFASGSTQRMAGAADILCDGEEKIAAKLVQLDGFMYCATLIKVGSVPPMDPSSRRRRRQ